MAKKKETSRHVIALNKRARFEYEIASTLEAGIALQGSEVKSLRAGQASIKEAYATEIEGEIFLVNANIAVYKSASHFNHEPKRARKLLLKRREIRQLVGAVSRKGMTIVPLSLYFNRKGIAKVELGLAAGKKQHDKRQAIKERDWKRDKERLLKTKE